ncbi:MAG: NAD(P)/FAD-dependent oxidoreductase [Thermoplasmatota archaeon]
MDRARFDVRMAQFAVAAGAELWTGAKAVGATRDATGVTLEIALGGAKGLAGPAVTGPEGTQPPGRTATVRARLVVGADGIRSSVARWFSFPPVEEIVSCYEAELSGVHLSPDAPGIIPMFAGSKQAPGFFSWIIPVGQGRARAGLAVAPGMGADAAKAHYERMFVDPQSAPYLKGARPEYLIIGGIPIGLRARLVDDRVALVGDAAGMAKPTSGGGIHFGLIASEHLARVAGPALAMDRLSRGDLLRYERRVRGTIGRELRRGRRLRALYKRLTDRDFNRLAHLLATPRARRAIVRHGHIDYPSRLVLPLLWAQPRLAPLFLRIALRPPEAP